AARCCGRRARPTTGHRSSRCGSPSARTRRAGSGRGRIRPDTAVCSSRGNPKGLNVRKYRASVPLGAPMDRLTALIDRAEEEGCVNLSQFSELVQELELDEEELSRVYEDLSDRGIELSDDCGVVKDDDTVVINGDL